MPWRELVSSSVHCCEKLRSNCLSMKITIITINFNNARGLERTVRSVVTQTYSEVEYIIVDGASKDGSIDIIEKYSKQIAKWVSEPDTGIYNAMNKGIRMATGDYCIFMNSGDAFCAPDVLTNVQTCLKSGKDIYNGNAFFTSVDGKITGYRKGHKEVSKLYFYHSSICHQASFIKTAVLKKYMYDESLRMVSDWKFWIEAICLNLASYEAINVDVCCYDGGGITATQQERGMQERRKVLEELYTPEELLHYEKLSKQRDFIKYLEKGILNRILLYYARIFRGRQVHKIYCNNH